MSDTPLRPLRVVRPNAEAKRINYLLVVPFSVIFGVLMAALGALNLLLPSSRVLAVVYFTLAALVVVLPLAWLRMFFRNTRIEYGGGAYARCTALGRRRPFTAADVRAGALTPALQQGIAKVAPALCLASSNRAVPRQLSGLMWPADELPLLAADLSAHGAPVYEHAPSATALGLRAIDRGLVPWRLAHPGAFMLLALGIAFVAAVTVIVIVLVIVAASAGG